MRFDRRSALLAAAAGSAAMAGAVPARAQRGPDRDTLERLLGLERGLQSAYEAAARRAAIDRDLATLLARHEREHARGLERVLAGADRSPRASVPSAELNRALASGGRAFLRYALRLESEAVAAYTDAVATLRDESLLQPLGSILTSEGQHLVVLRGELGIEPVATAFETGEVVG